MPASPTLSGSSGRAIPTTPIALIIIVFFLAVDFMLGQANRSGYVEFVDYIVDDDRPRFLPGSERLLLRHYVGIPFVDRTFTMLNVFFANIADGSSPALSLFGFYFGMQLASFLLVLIVESKRAKWSTILFNPIPWGLAVQAFGFGIIFPVFLIVHLLSSSKFGLADKVRLSDPTSLHTVVPAYLLGYFLPSMLMAYPFPLANVRQWCCALWQLSPVYIIVLQFVLTTIVKRTSIGQDTFTPPAQLDRAALSHAYGFAWNAAVTGQLCTIAVLATSAFLPGLYPPGVAESLTPENVFIPGAPHSFAPMESAAASFHDFCRYDLYLGSVAALIWAVHLLSEVRPVLSSSEERKNLGRGMLRSLLLSGPGGTLIALLQHRDETVLAAEIKAEKSH